MYIFNEIIIFIQRIIYTQRIIYIFSERTIRPIKYIYLTNELKYFYPTKYSLNLCSIKFKLEN